MVYNGEFAREKERLTAFLTAKLTPAELDSVQDAFGKGSFASSPACSTVLYIVDKPEYHDLSLADIRRAETDGKPFLVIDAKTPEDGGIWYIDNFAAEDEVKDGEAESTNVLWRIRCKLEHVVSLHANYDVANGSIPEDLDGLGVELPLTEDFEQEELATSGLDPDTDEKFFAPTWVELEPGEYEESSEPEILKTISPPRHDKLYRINAEVGKANGLLSKAWFPAGTAKPLTLEDGSTKTFPEGSIVLQVYYDPEFAWPGYQRPEGSL